MTCWPCSSASALRTDASGPGSSPRRRAESVRIRMRRSTSDSTYKAASRWRRTGSSVPPWWRTRSSRSSAVGPWPQSAPSPDSDTRSLPSVTFARRQPSCSSPTRFAAGTRTSVEEHLVEVGVAVHLPDRADRDPGVAHVDDEVRDAVVPVGVGVGPGEQDPAAGEVRERRPDLLAVDDVLVAVARRPRRSATRGRSPHPAR